MSFPIHLNNIPFVHQYVNKLIKDYQKIAKQLKQGDILAVSEIQGLKEKMKTMIKKMDQFYNLHYMDQRLAYLYSIRAQLNRVLSNSQMESFIKSANQSQSTNPKQKDSIQEAKKQQKPTKKINKQELIKIQEQSEIDQIKSIEQHNTFNKTNDKNLSNYPLKNMKNSIHKNNQTYLPLKQKKHTITETRLPFYNQNQHIAKNKYQRSKSKQKTPVKIRTSKKTQSYTPKKLISSQTKPNVHVFNSKQRFDIKQQSIVNQTDSIKTHNKSKQNEEERQINRISREVGSTSIKNLANLIFTIKMTRQEYNDFMKIKEVNQSAIN